ncbi:hypothetical protein [Nocardia sp. CDC160]|uniref:hypothetical protein n=1 Tax=Nocardia sp. CDC160 TaxID=3112166 RepID=UPI002DBC60C3|nr:hypothetical protein [Nocardia sp. CDC160]MEC3915790.1 hypothetical protein [Nocardia sp. CDC160]
MSARRATVMSPQTRLAQARRHRRPALRPIPPPVTDLERALRSYRGQRRRAVPTLLLLCVLVFGIPVLLSVYPDLDRVRALDIPVSWLVLWLAPYPALAALGGWHLRRAERAEGDGGAGPD